MNLWFLILIPFSQIVLIKSVIKYTLDEDLTNCSNGSSGYIDVSTIKLTMINETHTVVNGKIIATKTIKSPWKAGFYAEMYDRGQWSLMYQRRLEDFCTVILSPLEM